MFLQDNVNDISEFIGMIIAFIAVIITLANLVTSIRKPKSVSLEDKLKDIEEKLNSEKLDPKLFGPLDEDDEDDEDEDDETVLYRRKSSKASTPTPPSIPELLPKPSDRGWPRPEEKFIFHPTLDDFKQKTRIEERKLDINLRSPEELVSDSLKAWGQTSTTKKKQAPVTEMLAALKSKKALIVALEIMEAPVSIRRRGKFRTYE